MITFFEYALKDIPQSKGRIVLRLYDSDGVPRYYGNYPSGKVYRVNGDLAFPPITCSKPLHAYRFSVSLDGQPAFHGAFHPPVLATAGSMLNVSLKGLLT